MSNIRRMFHVVDVHSGEPARVITGGIPHIPGNSIYEQLKWLEKNDDQIRRLMLREPRGYPPICCNLIVPPKDPRAAAGYLIMEQDEYPLMSGSNTISVAVVLLETGIVRMEEPVTEFFLEGAAGLIQIKASCRNGKVTDVTFENIPAFTEHLDVVIDVTHVGKVTVDVAWGGVWFVLADVEQFGMEMSQEQIPELMEISALMLQSAREQLTVRHPMFPEEGIMIPMISGPPHSEKADLCSIVTNINGTINFKDSSTWKGAIDRSPCGTGTSAKIATLHAKGRLKKGELFRHANLLDVVYNGRIVEETRIEDRTAIVPAIGGTAWITQYSTVVLDKTDPFPEGYMVRDLWQQHS
jgi:proline racemase